MHIQCPHCNGPIEIVGEQREVVCPSCGSSIEVEAGRTLSWTPSGNERRLGKFELLNVLGIGAYGTVFKARDTELGRLVAVKIPRGGNILSDTDGERFLREARSVAQLEHPGIVSVFDAASSDGVYYIASRLVEGETLADRLARTRLDVPQAAELLKQVAEAVHYAHERGVIHRDLKPSNVMLDMDNRPHVMDFGLAKRDAGEITVTLDGLVLGTPAYMSPEQAKGEAHMVDARSDVYSLGVMLYELLTGELPFQGNRRMLLVQVLKDEPRPPRRLNNHVPRDLETICLTCLAKEPARRYRTAADLAAELGRWLAGEPIHASPIGPLARSWRWCRRKPVPAALISVASLLLLTLGIGGPLVAMREAGLRKTAAELAGKTKRALERERKALKRARQQTDLARQQTALAQHEARVSNAHRLAWVSVAIRDRWPIVSTLLALAAIDATRKHGERAVAAAEDALRDALGVIGGVPIPGQDEPVTALTFSRDGRWLVIGSGNNSARVWDLSAADPTAALRTLAVQAEWFPSSREGITCLGISPDDRWLVTNSVDDTARIWDMAATDSPAQAKILHGHDGRISCLAISPDGRWLVTGSGDTTARIWDLAATNPATEAKVLHGHEGGISSLAISPDGRWLVTGSGDKTARIWDLAVTDPAAESRILRGHTDMISCLAITPDSRWLITGSQDTTARIWDLAADPAAEPKILHGHEALVLCLAISPDGRWLVTGSGDKTARMWDLTAADPTKDAKILHGHESPVLCLAISPDGRWLVTASGVDWHINPRDENCDMTARVWDLAAADPAAAPKILRGHESRGIGANDPGIKCLAISPDSRWLVTGSTDQSARIWDLAADDPAAVPKFIRRHEVLRSLSGRPEEPYMESDDKWMLRFIELNDLMDLARAVAGRDLNRDERNHFQTGSVPGIQDAMQRNWSAFLQEVREHNASRKVKGK